MSPTSFQPSFWDSQDPQEKLMQEIPMLGRLAKTVPWEDFRPLLESIFEREGKSPVGRKHTDVSIMFKLLVLQQYLNCSDMRLESQVRNNQCLRYFVGLGVEDSVPDAKTVWHFRRRIQQAGIAEQLFHSFNDHLKKEGLAPCGGQIIDSTIIPVPKQHNRREENAAIKRGELPQGWEDNPARLRQKDQDARWVKKNQASYFGYKNSISIDATHGLIRSYEITPANVHDSQMLPALLDGENSDPMVWADAAYRGKAVETLLQKAGYESRIQEKEQRDHPLSDAANQRNRERSKIRCRAEHVFGRITNSMQGKLTRCIGLAAVTLWWFLRNLTYNFIRFAQHNYDANYG